MKKLFLSVLLLLFTSLALQAQEIKISSVRPLSSDLQARTKPRKDLNGDNCALLKVAIPVDGLLFKGSVVGEVEHTAGIYYVYVPAGTKKLEINHDKYYPVTINFGDYDITIEKNVTYSVILQRSDAAAAEWQFLVIEVSPKNAVVELDGTALAVNSGVAQKLVEVGSSHHYKVSMGGMVTQEGDVFVESADKKTVKQITLVSNSSPVSIKAAVRSEIWINGEKKSSDGTWKGTLLADSYLIEARVGGKVIGSEVHNIEQSNNLQEINIKLFYGSLTLTSNTPGAIVDMDGTIVGETPLFLREVLPGTHLLTATKDGYYTVTKEVDVVAKQNQEVEFQLLENLEVKKQKEEEAARLEELKRQAEEKAAREAADAAKAAEQKRIEEEQAQAAIAELKLKQAQEEAQRAEAAAAEAAAKQAKKDAQKGKGSFFVGADLGLQGLKTFGGLDMTYGAMVGYAAKFGGYARYGSNFGKQFQYENSDVIIDHTTLAAGVLMKVAKPVYVYAGAGCEMREIKLLNILQRGGGVGADTGAIVRFGDLGLSVGAFVPINVKHTEAHVGLSLFF